VAWSHQIEDAALTAVQKASATNPDDELAQLLFSSQNTQSSDFTFSPVGLDTETSNMSPLGQQQSTSFGDSWENTNFTTDPSTFAISLGEEYPTWDDQVWDQFLNLDLQTYGASMDGAGIRFPSMDPAAPAKAVLSPYLTDSPAFSNRQLFSSSVSTSPSANRPASMSRSPTSIADDSLFTSSSVPQLSPDSYMSRLSSPGQSAITPESYAHKAEDYIPHPQSGKFSHSSVVAPLQQQKAQSITTQVASRKRKNSVGADGDVKQPEDEVKDDAANSMLKKSKKAAHNTVEKRYRQNLNSKIAELRDSIPALRTCPSNDAEGGSDSDSNPGAGQNLRKGQILSHATDYIRQLEEGAKRLRRENEALKLKMAQVCGLVGEGATEAAPMVSVSLKSGPQKAYKRAMQGATSPTVQRKSVPRKRSNSRKGSKMGNVLMGGLAGLTMLEGAREHEQGATTTGRGLFALPLQWLDYLARTPARVRVFGVGSYDISMMNLLRLGLLFSMLYGMLSSWLFSERTKKPQKGKSGVSGLNPAAPLLTSPLVDRQRAWLTAIQSVWVPGRSFFLEVCAVGLKLCKIFFRWLVGWQGYAMLTGTTQEDEAARIKAWDIAIDAQLTGGDSEINNDRILLTFLASITLPTSSLRLALKALHLQILLWRLESNSWLQMFGSRAIAMSWTRYFWANARRRQQAVELAKSSPGTSTEADALPNHHFLLLQQLCLDVFTDNVMLRAYNLAWNKPTRQGVNHEDVGMDAVVQDRTIITPLNAVAAWWSSSTLRESILQLIDTTGDKDRSEKQKMIFERMSLAARIAPPGSNARLRALTAVAVFQNTDRKANLAAAVQALKSSPKDSSASGTAEIRIALRCALLNATLQSQPSSAPTSSPTSDLNIQRQKLLKSIISIVEDCRIELLGFAAAYSSLTLLSNQSDSLDSGIHLFESIEELAAVLRILVGGEARRRWGLSRKTASGAVTMCLEVCKRAAGVRDDQIRVAVDVDSGVGVDGYVEEKEKESASGTKVGKGVSVSVDTIVEEVAGEV
jgi:hypothetical protein